jgi:hypothetical protein
MNQNLAAFISQTLGSLTIIAGIASAFLLVRAGYLYISSTGNPEQVYAAKQSIKHTLLGLVIVLGASTIVAIATHAWQVAPTQAPLQAITLSPVTQVQPDGSLSQIIIEATVGFIKQLVESSLKPLIDGLFQFLTSTPLMSTNGTIFQFWVVMVGIANGLFILVVALLGLHIMSAQSLGLEEMSLSQLFPKLLLTFIGANSSIFLIDWLIKATNTFTTILLSVNNGHERDWILSALDPVNLLTGNTNLFTLLLLLLLLLLVVALLIMYVGRLITLSLGAAISPLIFLLLAHPKTQGFGMNLVKSYVITVTIVVIHVLILQVSSGLLTSLGTKDNPLMNALLGIGMMLTLLKSSSFVLKLVLLASGAGSARAIGGQIVNVISSQRGIQLAKS